MPSTSKKQHNFMAAIANSPSFAKKVGVPQSVGKDFTTADKGRKFSKGGDTMASKMNAGFMAMIAKKKGTPAKKMADGGSSDGRGIVKTPGDKKLDSPGSYATKILPSSMNPLTKDNQGSPYGGLGKKSGGMTKMAGGGMTASAMGKVKTAAPSKDGVAEKGKTKGAQIKMAGSGVPNGIGSRVMKKGGMAKC